VLSEISGVVGLLVYMTQHGGLFACFPMVSASLWCSGISSKEVTTNLAAVSAKSLPRISIWPLILFSFAGRPSTALLLTRVTMVAMRGLWWWYICCVKRSS